MTTPTPTEIVRRTPLHDRHLALGARMVPFAGWEMPVQYRGILEEHRAVRERVGLFDVSHMGEFMVEGSGARAFLARMVPGDVTGLAAGRCVYTQFTRPDGGVVDDTIIGNLGDRYLVVVNASNREKVWTWLTEHLPAEVRMSDLSDEMALLALQGPAAAALMAEVGTPGLSTLQSFGISQGRVLGVDVWVSRTGYTGEDGFEIYVSPDLAPRLWEGLLAAGESHGLLACGLGARDVLRLEAGLPLYGHELTDDVTPVEASLGWTVKSTEAYLGHEILRRQLAEGCDRRLVGLTLEGRAIARDGAPVFAGEAEVGRVVSGTHSPLLQAPIATAFVQAHLVEPGTRLEVEIRGKRSAATVGRPAFYRRPRRQP
jgi:aminomethyltransferase